MGKDPAFLFYPNDYLGGTMGFSLEQHGAYILLLIIQFNNGSISDSIIKKFIPDNVFEKIQDKFEKDRNGNFYNIRLRNVMKKREKYTESRRKNINKRWNKNDKPLSDKKIDSIHMDIQNGNIMYNHMGNRNRNRNIIKNTIPIINNPPNLEEVKAYCLERKNGIDPEAFLSHYTAIGWVQGKDKKPIYNWKACVITWEKNDKNKGNQSGTDRSFELYPKST